MKLKFVPAFICFVLVIACGAAFIWAPLSDENKAPILWLGIASSIGMFVYINKAMNFKWD